MGYQTKYRWRNANHLGLGKAECKGSPILEKSIFPELIPVLGSQPTGNQSHKPGGGLPLLSVRLAVASPAHEHQRT